MIDWKTLVTAILSTTFIVGIIDFIIRESYKKLLDSKIEQVKEIIRQKGEVHDLQLNALILLNELVYRSRNSALEIIQLSKQESIDFNYLRELSVRIGTYNNALIEVLYEKRAILVKDIFQKLHKLKHIVGEFSDEVIILGNMKVDQENHSRIEQLFSEIDMIYTEITELVQNRIQVS